MEKGLQYTKMEINIKEISKKDNEVVLEVTPSIVILCMKEIGEIMPSMDLENFSGTINFSSKANFRMD